MTLDAKLSLMKGKMQRNKLALQKNPRAKQTTFGHFTQERFAHTLQQPDLRKQQNKNLLTARYLGEDLQIHMPVQSTYKAIICGC